MAHASLVWLEFGHRRRFSANKSCFKIIIVDHGFVGACVLPFPLDGRLGTTAAREEVPSMQE